MVDRVRIIVVTSGILVFGAAWKIYEKDFTDKWLVIMLIALWGVGFILSMWLLAKHYLQHTESIAEGARGMEAELLGEKRLLHGAFMRIHLDHNKWKLKAVKENDKSDREKTFLENLKKQFYDYSTFVIMWLGCLILLLFAFFEWM